MELGPTTESSTGTTTESSTGPTTESATAPTTGQPNSGDWLQESCDIPADSQCTKGSQRLLLISLDGFRADYLQRNVTPVISRLTQCGVHTPYLRSVFPTMTFPNHYSIVTGLYPESSGIVGNTMYDEEIGELFKLSSDEKLNPAWWKGEPIWITAKKQGKKTAAYFWVGSDVNISGIYPDTWHLFDSRVPYDTRIDTVLNWTSSTDPDKPDLMLTYFNEPDHKGHGVGPKAEEMDEILKSVDSYIGKLMNGLTQKGLHHCLNIVILADHGMTTTSCSREVNYSYYTDTRRFYTQGGTYGHINTRLMNNFTRYETEQSVSSVVEDLECKSERMKVFTKETVPKRHHVLNSNRIGNILLEVEDRWLLKNGPRRSSCFLSGNHGYDNIYKSMQGLFLAYGPAFKQRTEVKTFENIELYNLMCDVLGIQPAPNNGTQGSLDHLLRNPPQPPSHPTSGADNCVLVNRIPKPPCRCDNQLWTGAATVPPINGPPLQTPVPVAMASSDSCHLSNEANFSVLYSHTHNMPLWASFSLTVQDSWNLTNETLSDARGCVRDDPRIQSPMSDVWCQIEAENFTKGYLFEPVFATSPEAFDKSHSSSNIALMKRGFSEGAWSFLLSLMVDYSHQYGSFSVVTGPVWDRDADGHADKLSNATLYLNASTPVPIPTHYYIVMMKCSDTTERSCDQGGVDIVSFVLPHVNVIPNCLEPLAYLKDNVVRIRDIELLTGLQFFTELESTMAARLRTFLPVTIWPTTLEPVHVRWMDLPCEVPANPQCPGNSKPLLLISVDGFRADYLQRNVTPVISRLAQCGVHTPYLRSVFPTMTFPNHYSIVTGLYPESHGIVGNTMYDEEIGELFKLSSDVKLNPAWWEGEPIWITAKKQGKKTAAYFWVGSDVNISGIYPDEWHLYSGSVSYDTRVKRVLDWVSSSDSDKPDLMLTYFDEPDHEGHGKGPDDPKIDETLRTIDEFIEILMDGLAIRGLHQCVNIMLLADHGMAATDSKTREVDYADFTDTRRFLTDAGTYGHINTKLMANYTRYATEQSVSSVVEDLECKSEMMKVFTKETVPKRHHVLNSNRIGNILLEVEDTWLLNDGKKGRSGLKGNHGYDNIYKSMEALFIAYGPAFKQHLGTPPFENIELYNLMCDVLGINPAPNNGTEGSLYHLLRNPPQPPSQPTSGAANCLPVNRTPDPPCSCEDQVPGVGGVAVSSTDHPPQQHPVPVSSARTSSCKLTNTDYDVFYGDSDSVPYWASFILSLDNSRNITSGNISAVRGCIRDDGRVIGNTSNIWCQEQQDLRPGYLFEPYFSSSLQSLPESQKTTNIVPMHDGFLRGAWSFLLSLMVDYSHQYGSLSVVTGPIWDRDADGHADNLNNAAPYLDGEDKVPIPTHYYIVMMKCSDATETSCDQGGVDIVSFVLPHLNTIPNCMEPLAYLKDNVVRIRDIELLTGLQFFTELESTMAARLRTFLPVTIWPTSLEPTNWIDLPCPEVKDASCPPGTPPLILIGLDGFGADLLKRNVTPVVQRLGQCGVHAPYMRPVYPTLTFPNMYSIVTGLYPESHGIVANSMYDKVLDERFSIRTSGRSDPAWWGGEPIWNSAVKQGKTANCYFWTGSDIRIQGMLPNVSFPYSNSVSYEERVSTVLKWLDLPEQERPDFISLYFHEPDYTIHRQGTDSVKTDEALKLVDSMVGRLMDGLVRRNLQTCVNIIVVADHGMVDTSCEQQVKLKDYLERTKMNQVYIYNGADGQLATSYRYENKSIVPNTPPESTEEYLEMLQCINESHLRVVDKKYSPVRNHYRNNDRIPEILLQSDPGWLVSRFGYSCKGASHGWDNRFSQLGSLFVAQGPSFKNQLEIEPFESIELYNLMSELLGITPAPNNGTPGALNHVLKSSRPIQGFTPRTTPGVCSFSWGDSNRTRALSCSCNNSQADNRQIQTLSSVNTSQAADVEYGPPQIVSLGEQNLCYLQQDVFTTGFNMELHHPWWIFFLLSSATSPPDDTASEADCVLDDPRVPLPAEFTCSTTTPNLTLTSLLPQGFIGNYSKLSTASVLMYRGFKTGIWSRLLAMVQKWAGFPLPISVTTGPIFDNNSDGLADTPQQIRNSTDAQEEELPLATHFYLSLVRCEKLVTGSCEKYGVLSFVLPHLDHIPDCWDSTGYLLDNVVRIRDIELLTGLQFLTQTIPPERALKLRLYLPTALWNST
ncbi:uncharacterized protein LOC135470602 [Liolophura sinensis]|uniref:uncharacterized protein LOC135470602 n=1 Tax=Liolophura sinensis TaxID=3198878 RepID=UPI0031582661